MRATVSILPLLVSSLSAAPTATARATQLPEAPLDPKSGGGPFRTVGPGDLPLAFRAPASAVAGGPDLVLLLHDAGGDETSLLPSLAEALAPSALLVAPRGPTPALGGGFRFRPVDRDVRRVMAVVEVARTRFGVRRAFALGHGAGGLFALALAQREPELFAGAAALGAPWSPDVAPISGDRTAACVVHGRADRTVDPSDGVRLAERLASRGGRVRLRLVEGAGHDLAPGEWNGALAWLRGTVSDDPAEVAEALSVLRALAGPPDLAGRLEIGRRLLAFPGGPAEARRRAAADLEAIEALSRAHLEAIRRERGRRPVRLEARAWIGHVRLFLSRFASTEAAEALRDELSAELLRQRDRAAEELERRRRAAESDPRAAFLAGVDAVAHGFLTDLVDENLLAALERERARARELGLRSSDVRHFDRVVKPLRRALEEGRRAFEEVGAAP